MRLAQPVGLAPLSASSHHRHHDRLLSSLMLFVMVSLCMISMVYGENTTHAEVAECEESTVAVGSATFYGYIFATVTCIVLVFTSFVFMTDFHLP
jgi:type III secretory pathway component EscU